MSKRSVIFLLLAGLAVSLLAAVFEDSPGYMDADYYYAGALRIVSDQGDVEPYLWNYLNDPPGLPVPAFAYWMPLTSYLAAVGLYLLPAAGFWAARLFFILLSALVPLLTALLSFRLTGSPGQARLAGLLALFSGFYLTHQTTIDAFPIYMVLGTVYLLVAFASSSGWQTRVAPELRLFVVGGLTGLLHLARADGILWLLAALLVVLYWHRRSRLKSWRLLTLLAVTLLGYGLVMAPWFGRNLAEWGSLMPPGGSRALWVTEYEQTMIFPAGQLTFQHWLAAGFGAHLLARWNALLLNSQTAVAVQGGIVLLPFILVGLWELRRRPEVQLGGFMWLALFLVMTLVFPFAGPNGSFYHSGAALQVLFWAAAPLGIIKLMERYAGWRRLPGPEKITRFIQILVVVTLALMSGALYAQRVIGTQPGEMLWSARYHHYQQVEQVLVSNGIQAGEAVLVNNPPGYWLASGRPAIVVPYGEVSVLLAAARRYGAKYLILEITNPRQLSDLYHGRSSNPDLAYLTSLGSTRLYRLFPSE